MKLRFLGVGVALVVGMVSLVSVAAAGIEEDLAAIKRVRELEVAGVNEAMPDNVTMVYAKDVVSIPPGEPMLIGTDAVEDWLIGMTDVFEANLEYTDTDINLLGDWAVEQYEGDVTLTPKDGGDPINEHVRGIHVYHRGEDGSWKIIQDIWNYDAPEMSGD